VLLDGHEEDHQEAAEVLRAGQTAGDDGARVVVEDRHRVDLEIAQAVVKVADVRRPVLVASRRLEGHRLGLSGNRLRLG
jgi:thiamine monophosphate synthase